VLRARWDLHSAVVNGIKWARVDSGQRTQQVLDGGRIDRHRRRAGGEQSVRQAGRQAVNGSSADDQRRGDDLCRLSKVVRRDGEVR